MRRSAQSLSEMQRLRVRNALKGAIAVEFDELETASPASHCPRCGGSHVATKGTAAGRRRMVCKDCGRNFGAHFENLFNATRLSKEAWLDYADCIVDGLSLRESASRIGVTLKTSCSMRKKIKECAYKHLA